MPSTFAAPDTNPLDFARALMISRSLWWRVSRTVSLPRTLVAFFRRCGLRGNTVFVTCLTRPLPRSTLGTGGSFASCLNIARWRRKDESESPLLRSGGSQGVCGTRMMTNLRSTSNAGKMPCRAFFKLQRPTVSKVVGFSGRSNRQP